MCSALQQQLARSFFISLSLSFSLRVEFFFDSRVLLKTDISSSFFLFLSFFLGFFITNKPVDNSHTSTHLEIEQEKLQICKNVHELLTFCGFECNEKSTEVNKLISGSK